MNEKTHDPHAGQPARTDRLSALLRASGEGDAQAFEAFYDATVQDALDVARNEVGERLEEVLTGSYVLAWRDAGRFDPAHTGAIDWLLAIVRAQSLGATNDSEFST